MVSYLEIGSDLPIGSDRESGHDILVVGYLWTWCHN